MRRLRLPSTPSIRPFQRESEATSLRECALKENRSFSVWRIPFKSSDPTYAPHVFVVSAPVHSATLVQRASRRIQPDRIAKRGAHARAPEQKLKLPFLQTKMADACAEMSEAVTWREPESARRRRRDGESKRERRSDIGCVAATKWRNFRIAGDLGATAVVP
jgi:hypothetical protein